MLNKEVDFFRTPASRRQENGNTNIISRCAAPSNLHRMAYFYKYFGALHLKK